MTDLSGILPGDRIAWNYEPSSPESGPSGQLDVMEGTVLLCNAGASGRAFWTLADDGSRLMVEPSWIVPPDVSVILDRSTLDFLWDFLQRDTQDDQDDRDGVRSVLDAIERSLKK